MDLQTTRALRLIVELCRGNQTSETDPAWAGLLTEPQFRDTFLRLAADHHVAGLVHSRLVGVPGLGAMGHEIDHGLRVLRRRATMFAFKRDRILSALQADKIPVVTLKGAAMCDTLYNDPVERDVEDLDILVRKSDLPRAIRAVEAQDYLAPPAAETRTYETSHFHIPMTHADGHTVEIHWALSRPTSPFHLDSNVVFEEALDIERPGLPSVRMPRPEHMLLHIVLQNLQENFSRLSRLVDIAAIVEAAPELNWESLIAAARRGNMESATALSCQLARRILESPIPAEVVRETAPPAVSRFHLAAMRPARFAVYQLGRGRFVPSLLLEFWLLRGAKHRLFLLSNCLDPIRMIKLLVLQFLVYGTALISCATPGRRASLRFWSSTSSAIEEPSR